MKDLLTISALLVSSLAMAQFPSLPYNPDENGDGLIGVVDLQGLLANYGNEFASAVVSEDGESAIVFMGEMGLGSCEYACENLPGFWQLPRLRDLEPVQNEITNPTSVDSPLETWLRQPTDTPSSYYFKSYINYGYQIETIEPNGGITTDMRCYCAAKQLPRVEYSYCMTTGSTYNYLNQQGSGAVLFQSCCDDKVENGWYPVGGISKGATSDGAQAFWRWAE